MAHVEPSKLAGKLPVGTVTFLFTDVEGSTRLARRLRERYGEVLQRHQALLREAFAAHEGLEMDTQGDSFFFAFARARNALAAAVAGQRALAQAEWPDGAEVRVRMGLHTGEPSVSENRYLGLAVHRAARICAAGHGGQIVVSPATVAVLSDDELADVELRDLGEYVLKDFDEPQRLYQAVLPELPADFPALRAERARPPRLRLRPGTSGRLPRARLGIAAAAVLVLVVPPVVWLATRGGSAERPAQAAPAPRLTGVPNCPIFPKSSPWNRRVDGLPAASNSAQLTRSIGLDTGLHPDFGAGKLDGGPIGIPVNVVSSKTPRVRLRFQYASESDKGPYPIPRQVKVEHGGDRHTVIVDRSSCRLYELNALHGRQAGSGAIWNLKSNKPRPLGWTSADAAGLPILPGLVRWDEVKRGRIDHALRFSAEKTRDTFIYPARHQASHSNDHSLPPMGLRVRLKAGVPISDYPYQARVVLEALKRYGMLLADNGSSWYISGEPSRHWSNEALHILDRITGRDLEVVDTRYLRP